MAHLTRNLRHSMISDHLASVAKSVLIQYGVGGKVGPVTQGPDADLWSIQLLNVDGSTPGTLTLRCTESTPPHSVRTAMTTQLGI